MMFYILSYFQKHYKFTMNKTFLYKNRRNNLNKLKNTVIAMKIKLNEKLNVF